MARKYNLDKVSNYLLTETTLSADECHNVLDVVLSLIHISEPTRPY